MKNDFLNESNILQDQDQHFARKITIFGKTEIIIMW